MEIAPGVDHTYWARLALDDPTSPDWAEAVQIFASRIRSRFLDAAYILEKAEAPAGKFRFGFAILALDCLLIEALYQFRKGLPDTKNNSKKAFTEFLTNTPEFSPPFNEELASQFYDNYRNGILHQAEVKGLSRVKASSRHPLVRRDRLSGMMIINRSLFHDALVRYFERYLAELKEGGSTNDHLRQMFRKKMDFVCRVNRTGVIKS